MNIFSENLEKYLNITELWSQESMKLQPYMWDYIE